MHIKVKDQLLEIFNAINSADLTYDLNLIQTGDVDALIQADYFYKSELKKILPKYGFIYDEDSPYIFIPEDSHFNSFASLSLIEVDVIDPESALVSKAVKAPEKNKNLIREALHKNTFLNLAKRIIKNGGNLSDFK
jgi:hypothetical protein